MVLCKSVAFMLAAILLVSWSGTGSPEVSSSNQIIGDKGLFAHQQYQQCPLNCENGGMCIERDDGEPMCHCPEGAAGRRCEHLSPHVTCGSNRCYNNATCSHRGDACSCSADYTGAACVINRKCTEIQCKNFEVCLADGPEYMCQVVEGIYQQLFWNVPCSLDRTACSKYDKATCIDGYCGCPHGYIVVNNRCEHGKLRCKFHVDCQAVAIDMVCIEGLCECHRKLYRHPATGVCSADQLYPKEAEQLNSGQGSEENSKRFCTPWCWIVAGIVGAVVVMTITLLAISTSQEQIKISQEMESSKRRSSLVLNTSVYQGRQSAVEYYSVHQITLTPKLPSTNELSQRKSTNTMSDVIGEKDNDTSSLN